MKICVLSGHYPGTKYMSADNHRIYCSHHGYYYIHCNWPTPAKNVYLNKFYFIQHYIDLFDYIFWIDDDAFFLDMKKGLEEFIPTGENIISICKSPSNKTIKTVFNSGTFIINCKTGKTFVNNVLNTDLKQVKYWWKPEHGYFTDGDQDIMVYLYLTHPEFQQKFQLFNHLQFNSRIGDLTAGNDLFLIHITGTKNVKKKTYKKLQVMLGTDRTLVAENAKNDYKVIDTSKLYYILKMSYYSIRNLLK